MKINLDCKGLLISSYEKMGKNFFEVKVFKTPPPSLTKDTKI